ncbi:MAG: hypothetical protein JEZ00_19900 [Anaerolineaceae bacterium]|nr:hypothetical protein [Anaerolineaceae bacterium]
MKNTKNSIRIALWVIAAFIFLTIADAPAPNYGVTLVAANDGKIIVDASYGNYCSIDGGFNWELCNHNNASMYEGLEYQPLPISIQIPDSQIQYRITQYGAIQTSDNDGSDWYKLPTKDYSSNVLYYYQQQMRPNAYITNTGAQDIAYDPPSGNVIIAMGLQGIIIIPPDRKAVQVGIGENQPAKLSDPWVIISILFPYLLLTIAIIAILYASIIIIARQKSYWVLILITLFSWGYLSLVLPELFSGYAIIFGIIVLFVVLILIMWILLCADTELSKIEINDNQHKRMVMSKALPGGLAYFLCYILWYINIIPNRQWAIYISFGCVLTWFIYCIIQSYRWKHTHQDTSTINRE